MSSENHKENKKEPKVLKIPEWPSPEFKCANPSKPCLYCNESVKSAGKRVKEPKKMHIYPSSGAGMLMGCECGEVSGIVPLDIASLWLRTASDKILN